MTTDTSPILLAFSGGLDTSFCVPWLKQQYSREVVTVTIDTGGIDALAAQRLEERALALGAADHYLIDRKQAFFDDVIRYLIAGNVTRGHAYPLCVGAERGVQARAMAELARERGCHAVAHGCTAAGNDQIRFEVALRTLNPDLEIIAPVRDNSWIREEQLEFLRSHDLPLPDQGSDYSINRGLWGITIGGKETLTSQNGLPEHAWVLSANAYSDPAPATALTLDFDRGVPTAINGESADPVALIERLERIAGRYGVGRGIHLGDTALGTKGRVAFEAPAAIALIAAHRELEKLVLSAEQARIKDQLSAVYGELIHMGQQLDLACRDIEALLVSSQERVSGTVTLTLRPGSVFIEGVDSPYSLLAATKGVYGESAGEWTAADALGHARIAALPGALQTRAAEDRGH